LGSISGQEAPLGCFPIASQTARGTPIKITKAAVERLKLPEGKSELLVFDEDLPGFGLRIRAGGKRTWVVQFRVGTRQRRMTIGTTETLDALAARKLARDMLAKAHLGDDPQLEKAEKRAEAAVTLAVVVENYLARYAAKNLKASTFTDVERYLKRHWAPLANLPVRKIERANVAARLAEIAADSGDFAANRARSTLNALFAWAIGEGLTDSNPVVGTNKPAEEIARDRVLNDEELTAIWREAGEGEYGEIVRLLILTGQRREEVGGMLWSEIDLDKRLWSIGGSRTKNGRPHDVPLSSPAIEILQTVESRDGRSLLFGAGKGAFGGWSRAKAALDTRMTAPPWRLHDVRRTVATRMADLGVQPHVVEAVLNHVSGHKAGVAGIYNRAAYAAEKRQALDLWGAHVVALVEGRASNVVALASARG
jgi:integrase